MNFKNLINDEKPRERLLKYKAENISNEDLLSIIIKTGTKDKSVKEVSNEILSNIKTINELKNKTINELIKIKGIGKIKAIEIIAAIELGRRVFYESNLFLKIKINNSNDIFKYFKFILKENDQEKFYCIYLDIKKNIIDTKLLFIGTINMSTVHPREIFKNAYLLSASFIICVHNHPSGDAIPSKEDILLTKELVKIGNMQKIPILDHIIIGNDYYSFYENKLI